MDPIAKPKKNSPDGGANDANGSGGRGNASANARVFSRQAALRESRAELIEAARRVNVGSYLQARQKAEANGVWAALSARPSWAAMAFLDGFQFESGTALRNGAGNGPGGSCYSVFDRAKEFERLGWEWPVLAPWAARGAARRVEQAIKAPPKEKAPAAVRRDAATADGAREWLRVCARMVACPSGVHPKEGRQRDAALLGKEEGRSGQRSWGCLPGWPEIEERCAAAVRGYARKIDGDTPFGAEDLLETVGMACMAPFGQLNGRSSEEKREDGKTFLARVSALCELRAARKERDALARGIAHDRSARDTRLPAAAALRVEKESDPSPAGAPWASKGVESRASRRL